MHNRYDKDIYDFLVIDVGLIYLEITSSVPYKMKLTVAFCKENYHCQLQII